MIKDIIIILAILIIIISGGIWTIQYLNSTTRELSNKLNDLKVGILKNENRGRIKNMSSDIYEEWHEKSEYWSIIVLHSELDLIETSLTKMKSEIEYGSLEKSINELDNSIFLINHIGEKEKFCVKNIL